ncbi:TadE/TadG family type IV pilus assembly protein [Streptomyces sp. B8F3]|uniref:TadE/TadG family type IV pilus assembly protein n=1 Tax=Streptomyces sp. B8F3 TaxID=3153573 RepID=UPI00325F79BB
MAARGQRGSASVELVLMLPVLVLMLFLIVYTQRGSEARMRIDDVAHQAARAASQQRTLAAAHQAAEATAETALAEAGISCQQRTLDVSGNLQPGSAMTVTLTCTVGLNDLTLLPLPATTDLDAAFTAPVDRYRTSPASATEGR